MDTHEHIIVHMFRVGKTNQALIRIIAVEYTSDYLDEFKRIYGDDEESLTYYVCYYNSAQWYDRLLNDLQYKKFKTMNIKQIAKSLWKIENQDTDTVTEWFTDAFKPFVQMKLTGYYEDDEEDDVFTNPKMIIDNMLKRNDWLDYEKTPIINDDFRVINKEVTDDKIVLTVNDVALLIMRALTSDYTPEGHGHHYDNPEPYLSKCDLMRGLTLKMCDTIPLNTIVGIIKELGINNELTRIRHSPQYNIYTAKKTINVSSFDGYTNLQQPHFAYIDSDLESPVTLDMFFAPISENQNTRDEDTPSTQDSKPSYCYTNIVTQEFKVVDAIVSFMHEFVPIGEITIKTEKGRSILDDLQAQESLQDTNEIIEDLESIISLIKKTNTQEHAPYFDAASSMQSQSITNDVQKMHTKTYVDKYKDDNSEILASHAIEHVFKYLSTFISPPNINMNKIGQDLVELGVKKTRKAKGNIYGLKSSSPTDPIGWIIPKSSFDKVIKQNTQLRAAPPGPPGFTAGDSPPPWNMSSWATQYV